jgi:predicted amidophosphoribosyltransferase
MIKKNCGEFLKDLFFPKFCLGCQKEETFLCNDCRELLEIGEFDYCLCNKPLRIFPDQKNGKCKSCQIKKLSGLYFAVSYKNVLAKRLIRQFKYEPYLKDLKSTLAGILIEHFVKTQKNTDEIWENSILIPVPTDNKKLKIRGYNQSEELAKELSKTLKVPVASDILIKIKKTAPQMELSKQEREKNLLDAFSINKKFAVSDTANFCGKKVFLVDDVYTTGSTMEECAKILKEAGAKQVWGIAFAREE